MSNNFKIIIAGGKTGGHLFPGIAIAQAILRINSEAQILFVGSGEPFETKTLSRYGFTHERITSTGIKGKGILQKIKALLQIPISIIQGVNIIKKFKPDIVLGVGGFSSGPVVLGARICGIKTAIQEQNSIAGITNRILEHFVNIIFTSFKETKRLTQINKMVHTGNPIRKNEIGLLNNVDNHNKNENSLRNHNNPQSQKRFTILVTGGSQGAKSINSAFIEALQLMNKQAIDKKDQGINELGINELEINELEKYRIIHQTGATDEKRILEAYEKMGVKVIFNDIFNNMFNDIFKNGCSNDSFDVCVNNSFYISASAFFNDLPEIQKLANLIICRAGAGTISEITAIGKPALLVPYPYAADDHQTYNAKSLADNGAAWVISDSQLSGEILKEKIEFAYTHPEELAKMAQKAKEIGNPFADEMIASICIKMAKYCNNGKLL